MRPENRTLTANGDSAPILADYQQQDFKVALQVNITGGTVVDGAVQSTLDDPRGTSVNWVDVSGMDINVAVTVQGNIFFPVRGVRLSITDIGTATEVELVYLQANAPG